MLNYTLNLHCAQKNELKEINHYFKTAMKIINQSLKITKKRLFEVSLIDDKAMKTINYKYRHINKPTDVLSFAFDDSHTIETTLIGEIFIDVQQAQRQSIKNNLIAELTLLFIHGTLHLLGYDHANNKDEKCMFSIQNKIMKQLNLLR
ncbi:MAG: rRNA maturation RNase YbeY [Mycoplasmataceae bacterium]|jgi:probable rRNA maturation factor|nr:rRNA maturation RNase YbeY [Mycoplasmataceae bacterium]